MSETCVQNAIAKATTTPTTAINNRQEKQGEKKATGGKYK